MKRGCSICDNRIYYGEGTSCGLWYITFFPWLCNPPTWKRWKPKVIRNKETCKFSETCDCYPGLCKNWEQK